MRGQPGPCLALGNYPAARRFVRNRKPPPIILWSIGIITCLLFVGAAIMLTVGYLNPFGTVGLAILGVGAVVYFGAIIFLVLSCLWVERKYPGMQPLSFKIYSRKQSRVPPTTFTNPNVSGQMPADTTPSYRMHNELPVQIPGFSNVGGKKDKKPSTPNDKSQEKKDNTPLSHGSSPGYEKNPIIHSTALNVLQEEDHNGGKRKDDNLDIRCQALTNTDNVTMNEDSSTGLNKKSHSHPEQNNHGEGAENDNNASDNPKRERKVKLKTHHIEVPFEDYASDSSTSQNIKKDKSKDMQKPNPRDNSQNDNLPTTGASKSTSPPKTSAMDEQKEVSSSVNNLSHARNAHPIQRTKAAAHSTDKDINQASPNLSYTHKSRITEEDEKIQNGLQTPSSFQPTVHARKPVPEKHQNNKDSSKMVQNLLATNSASPLAVRKSIEHENYESKSTNSAQKDSAANASPGSDKKRSDVHKNNATNPDHAQESVQEKSQVSSLLNIGKNALPHSNNPRREHQNTSTSPKQRTQNAESQSGSTTRAQKMQSPDRAQKIRKDNVVPNSPPINRKADVSSSPPRHHQKRPDNSSEAQRTKEQSITIQMFSSGERKEEIQKKKILHSSTSSQSSELPSSSSSSSPRQRQRSPNKSPTLPRNGDHTTKKVTFHSSPRNEDFSNRKSHHSSPSSQSSDVPSSRSSSPQRTQQKSPDLSTIMQRHKDIPVTSVVPLSSNKKDELHKRHSQPSSQSSDVLSSPSASPLSAKKLLQNKKEQTNPHNQTKSVPQQRTNK